MDISSGIGYTTVGFSSVVRINWYNVALLLLLVVLVSKVHFPDKQTKLYKLYNKIYKADLYDFHEGLRKNA